MPLIIQNFLLKLKLHLYSRSKYTSSSYESNQQTGNLEPDTSANDVIFKHDRIYQHKIMRINYTTYDVRRSQDAINPSTPHCNVMVLGDSYDDSDYPTFRYAKVLGIFHANVLDVDGRGIVDYEPRRLEFLWVRWYQLEFPELSPTAQWNARKLDCLYFPQISGEDAFGFINPSDVLRSAHVIPAFSKGMKNVDGVGLSFNARDGQDWNLYYVNRCV